MPAALLAGQLMMGIVTHCQKSQAGGHCGRLPAIATMCWAFFMHRVIFPSAVTAEAFVLCALTIVEIVQIGQLGKKSNWTKLNFNSPNKHFVSK